ncbi:MAG: aldehyde dehydrogenase family protein [Planctomycetota bacterium]|nr:aldehyde dehydrogenase family protein [Planctomycetota bacterium]
MTPEDTNPSDLLGTLDWGPAPEATAQAREWIENSGKNPAHFIDGEWIAPAKAKRFPSHYPATGEELRDVLQGTAEDVDQAVQAASKALPQWQKIGGAGRSRHLYAIARAIQKESRLFAVLETLDNGKPIRETRDIDVPLVARHFYHHAGWARILEETDPDASPWGVCGQIIPWNFPLLMLAWKVAPALACGNTVVLKPAEWTSLTALLFAEICQKVGLPAGVFNLVTGDGDTGAAIVSHPDIDKIAFTGSTEVGKIIRKATAGTGKGLTLELGGKSPFIIFEDADLDSAVEGLVDAIWFNQGQVCCAGSRLLIQESVADEVHRKVEERMSRLRVGDPLDKAIDMGAMVEQEHLDRVREMCSAAIADGLSCFQPEIELPETGYWYPPTLFANAPLSADIVCEEVFGPVLVSTTFRTPAEAIKIANHTRYGLAASIWSQDIDTALEISRQVRAGTVWVNGTNLFDASSGFGGMKESGFGREGGKEGLRAYLRPEQAESSASSTIPTAKIITATEADEGLDRTAKLFIGGKQVRPDGGYSFEVRSKNGDLIGLAGQSNRKDVRNAVEAASGCGWGTMSGHARAQVLWFIAENLEPRSAELAQLIDEMTGCGEKAALEEVAETVDLWTWWASWSDKHDGAIHDAPWRGLVLALHEPYGTAGLICPQANPLSGLVAYCAPLLAAGNAVVAIPSTAALAAVEMCRIIEHSDLPPGALNLLTGDAAEIGPVLAAHDAVDLLWYQGNQELATELETASAGNMKVCWSPGDCSIRSQQLLDRGAQVKNIWLPHGI